MQEIIKILLETKRDGMQLLIDRMIERGYFQSPASTKYHECTTGGLARHSLSVYKLYSLFPTKYGLDISSDSIAITAICHDICKVGAYVPSDKGFKWNHKHPKGHGELSVTAVSKYINLTDLESDIIRFHMGFYNKERPFRDIFAAFNDPRIKLFYMCDELSCI